MFSTFKLAFVYLALGPLAGIIGIPYTLLVGDISLLYRVAMWITNAGVRAAGIKIQSSVDTRIFQLAAAASSCATMCRILILRFCFLCCRGAARCC